MPYLNFQYFLHDFPVFHFSDLNIHLFGRLARSANFWLIKRIDFMKGRLKIQFGYFHFNVFTFGPFFTFSDHNHPKTNRVMVRTCNGVELRDLPYIPVPTPPAPSNRCSSRQYQVSSGFIWLLKSCWEVISILWLIFISDFG